MTVYMAMAILTFGLGFLIPAGESRAGGVLGMLIIALFWPLLVFLLSYWAVKKHVFGGVVAGDGEAADVEFAMEICGGLVLTGFFIYYTAESILAVRIW